MKLALNTTLARKNLMALTGLFLCLFLIIHLAGNLQLLLPPERAQLQFNQYAEILGSLLLIKVVEWGLFGSIILHAIFALVITIRNRQASGPGYAYDKRKASSPWSSRNMGFLGSIILLFLVIHLGQFYIPFKFGDVAPDPAGRKDLYTMVIATFQSPVFIGFYIVSFLALAFHLWHGFYSAFKTLGTYNTSIARIVYGFGIIYTVAITAGFILIPIILFITR